MNAQDAVAMSAQGLADRVERERLKAEDTARRAEEAKRLKELADNTTAKRRIEQAHEQIEHAARSSGNRCVTLDLIHNTDTPEIVTRVVAGLQSEGFKAELGHRYVTRDRYDTDGRVNCYAISW